MITTLRVISDATATGIGAALFVFNNRLCYFSAIRRHFSNQCSHPCGDADHDRRCASQVKAGVLQDLAKYGALDAIAQNHLFEAVDLAVDAARDERNALGAP